MKDHNAMTEHEKGMMKDDKDAMMKNKMKAEKKGQAGKTDDKMKMNEKSNSIGSGLCNGLGFPVGGARRVSESKHRLASYSVR